MHIQKLVIYGFGQHEDIQIDLKGGINVFFGQNEAGKTTIQQFILSVLFGFPLRNQGLLRYEPKGGGKHGGQVHILHPEFGKVIVERTKGKSAGDVTVYFENGTRGDEESLKKVMYRYDRASFESIFSFTILQLQNFDKMTEDELSRTLLASGTTGVDAMNKLEQRASKEMNTLFKKSGKNPEMNVKIEEIRTLEQTLKDVRFKIDQYEPSILRISEIELNLKRLTSEELELKLQNEQFAKYRQVKPLLQQQQDVKNKLNSISQKTFPKEGIRRFVVLKDRVQELDIQIKQLQGNIEQAKVASFDKEPVAHIKQLESYLLKESEWHHLQLRKQQLSKEREQANQEMEQQMRLIGIKDEQHFSQVVKMDVSLQKEEHFQQIMNDLTKIEESLRYEQQGSIRLESELEETDRKLAELEDVKPTHEEIHLADKVPSLVNQLAELKARQHVSQEVEIPSNRSTIPFIVSGLILIVSILGAVLLNSWLIAGFGVVLAGIILAVLMKGNQPAPQSNKRDYREDISHIEKELAKAEQIATKVKLYQERQKQLLDQQSEKRHLLSKISTNLMSLKEQRLDSDQKLNEFLISHGFDGLTQTQLFPELFKRIRSIQELYQTVDQKSVELSDVIKEINLQLENMMELTNESLTESNAYHRLREVTNDWKNRQSKLAISEERKTEWMEQLSEKQKLFEVQSKEIEGLWQEAAVIDEASFYEADVAYSSYLSLQHELDTIEMQLNSIGEVFIPQVSEEDQNNRHEQLDERIATIEKTRHELLDERAMLKQQTNSLINDDHYGDVLQQFEQKKAELAELAQKWAVNKAVMEAIKQTMDNLKEKRLPFVLEKAQQFFTHLTGNRYEALEVNEEGIFEAINPQGIRYRIAELSQATKEQAYISLRFALAQSLLDTVPLPIIMDDPFVHFDRYRVNQMVQLMLNLESNHQFLYFTCHEEMKSIWPNAHVIDVATLHKERSVPTI
jgi:uncharacterized protein YhaN